MGLERLQRPARPMTYVPNAPSISAWNRIMEATGTTSIREALIVLVESSRSEADVRRDYEISRWPLRTALLTYNLKLNDGRKK